MRRVYLVLAGLLGAAVAVLPGLAAGDPPSNASFTAIDDRWEANGSAISTQVTIAQGGTVTFGYPSGGTQHNADFTGGPAPTGCTQTAGASSGAVPPVPHNPTSPGWSGTCTFNTSGTYTFHCDLHTFMTGTIVVQAPGSTTTTTTTTTATTTTTGPTTTTTAPTTTSPPPPPPPAIRAISIQSNQRGSLVRGSLRIAQAGGGAVLEVDVYALARSLGSSGRAVVRIGRAVLPVPTAGAARFAVALDGPARHAERQHPLSVTVMITVRTRGGTTASAKRTVRLRG